MVKPKAAEIPTPFRLHYSDGTTADVTATSADEARKIGARTGLLIRKAKVIKEKA